jgi:hypothetical protein
MSAARRIGSCLLSLQFSKALGGLDHAGGNPPQSHVSVPPPLHVARDAPDGAHHVLGDVGAGGGQRRSLQSFNRDRDIPLKHASLALHSTLPDPASKTLPTYFDGRPGVDIRIKHDACRSFCSKRLF